MNTTKIILKNIFGVNIFFTGFIIFLGFISTIPILVVVYYVKSTDPVLILVMTVGTVGLVSIVGLFISVFYKSEISKIKNISNMEKQSKALRKLGVDEFVRRTNSNLLHQSSRGNSLYESYDIIKNRKVRFLVYKDISTDRMYIKYVPTFDPIADKYLNTADEAQAWSLSMSLQRYERMTIEA